MVANKHIVPDSVVADKSMLAETEEVPDPFPITVNLNVDPDGTVRVTRTPFVELHSTGMIPLNFIF